MIRFFLSVFCLFTFAAVSEAGWLRDKIAARRCASGCSTPSGDCKTGCSGATANGCAGCVEAANPNGVGFTTASTQQTVCVNGKCYPASAARIAAPASSVDTIVIDGKAYRLTPIANP